MALTDVRAYFRTRMNALSYKEWDDGFNVQNIPSTILNGSYHIETGSISGRPSPHIGHEFEYPVTVRLFLKGYRTPASAIDNSITAGQNILSGVLATANRLGNGSTIMDIVPVSIEPIRLDGTNDNSVILELQFVARVMMNFT